MAFLSTMCPNVLIFIMNWISAGFSCLPVLLTYTVINGYLAPHLNKSRSTNNKNYHFGWKQTFNDTYTFQIYCMVNDKNTLNIKHSHKFKVNNKKKSLIHSFSLWLNFIYRIHLKINATLSLEKHCGIDLYNLLYSFKIKIPTFW